MIVPYFGRILVEPFETESVLKTLENKYQKAGKVIKCGDTSFFKEGDTILFNVWGVDTVEYKDKEYFFILEHPDFILGKYVDD